MSSPTDLLRRRPEAARLAGDLGPWLALAALGLWAATPSGPPLAVAAVALAVSAMASSPRPRPSALGFVAVVVGILAGFVAHRQVSEVTRDFGAYWDRREEEVGSLLQARLEALLQDAETAADGLAQEVARGAGATQAELVQLRRRSGVTALALYGPTGELRVWDGMHRGRVPEEVQRGVRRYAYAGLPLFGHIYVTAPAGDAGTAVAAVLLRTGLPDPLAADAGDFASSFRTQTGEEIRIVAAGAAGAAGGWDFRLGNRVLFTVVLQPPTVDARARRLMARWRVRVSLIAILAWLLLAAGLPAHRASVVVGVGVLGLLAVTLPFDEVQGLGELFRRAPHEGAFVTLGRWAALTAAAGIVVPTLVGRRGRFGLPWVAAVTAALYVLVAALAARWASAATIGGSGGPWVLYQAALAGTFAVATAGALASARPGRDSPRLALISVATAVGLGGLAGAWVWWRADLPVWALSAWSVPTVLAALAMGEGAPWWRRPVTWTLAVLLAGSAAVPLAWSHRIEARMEVGERYLERVADPADPEVVGALQRLGLSARSLFDDGERGVALLYDAWHDSGLADLGQPVWLTVWSPAGIPQQELRVGVKQLPAAAREAQADDTSPDPVRVLRFARDDARFVVRVRLPEGEVLTGTVPPFVDPAARFPLSPLLAGRRSEDQPLTLIPLDPDEAPGPAGVRWVRSDGAFEGEHPLVFPEDVRYHAHYRVDLPGPLLTLARATLLLLLDSILLLVLAAGGWLLRHEVLLRELRWGSLVVSFRARVTLALFGFFVLANAIFGTFAYRAIAGTSHRAAQVLAERVVDDASEWYSELGGRMQALARRVGVELLEYRGAELREGSVEELVELGLYEGWLPYRVHALLAGREGLREYSEGALGPWSYVTAFRRLPDGDVLAAQVPLQAGATAIRSADVAELLGLAVCVGAALSLGLALLVGRALTRPIHALQVASERVGAGNLGLRLPSERSDEFGSVFRAFNRMVGRLRRARRQLVRTSRRTQAIMDEAAVGMVALDASGRVTLVNPRAVGLLEMRLEVGEPLASDGDVGRELREWLDTFLARGAREGSHELSRGSRRIRVRARRLGADAGDGGAVVALEDVTDELRTERVLAWGEMARQVAHEVKNPLTPIKLSVQHLRRAWEDGDPDFGNILVRNADAMMAEIDRLAAIAKSFSRFGAPSGPEQVPLEPVDVGRVVSDILALYAATPGSVTFEQHVELGLPPVRARVAEVKEALVNLLENARAAARDGGRVRVEALAGEEGGVWLRVVDDGSGIPPELVGRVFEPHFSSRTTGTGLGLAIVRRLVESWGGEVTLGSEPGRGTTVAMKLAAWG